MTIDDKIRDEKLQNNINREAEKLSALQSDKFDSYDYPKGKDILPPDQNRIIEPAKLTYCSLGNVFEKQIKTIDEQGEKQIQGHLKSIENNKLNITMKRSLQHIQNKTKFMKILLIK